MIPQVEKNGKIDLPQQVQKIWRLLKIGHCLKLALLLALLLPAEEGHHEGPKYSLIQVLYFVLNVWSIALSYIVHKWHVALYPHHNNPNIQQLLKTTMFPCWYFLKNRTQGSGKHSNQRLNVKFLKLRDGLSQAYEWSS